MSKKPITKILQWKSEYLGYLLFEFLLSRFSLYTVYRLGEFLGLILCKVSPYYRGIVKRNLMMTLGKDDIVDPPDSAVEEVFMRNSGNMLTTLATGRKKITDISQYLEVRGENEVVASLENTGVILIMGHMGNWEILTKMTHGFDTTNTLGALYRPLNNPYMNELILKRRKASGMELISRRNPIKSILSLLERKGLMCVLSDQRIGNKGTPASFFGRETPCTRLPLIMHKKSEAPIYTASMESTTPGSWKLRFKRVTDTTQQGLMDALAESMDDSLTDCFWFQDRWQEFPPPSAPELDKQIPSKIYAPKPLPGIIESRTLLEEDPALQERFRHFPLSYWDEGGDPETAYFAIGNSDAFKKACKRVGIKKALKSPQQL